MLRWIRQTRRLQRGQGMTEYIVLVFFGLVLTLLVPFGDKRQNVIELFLEAYKTYYDSFYFVLNMPLP